jgi:hypothetical protein
MPQATARKNHEAQRLEEAFFLKLKEFNKLMKIRTLKTE